MNKHHIRCTYGRTELLRMSDVVRYSGRAKIKDENIAEHSFYVCANVLTICKAYGINDSMKAKALEFAVVHDIGELSTGDVPYPLKRDFPEMKAALDSAEKKYIERVWPQFSDSFETLLTEEKTWTTEALILKLADTMSVLQYTENELLLGNNDSDMAFINENAYERIDDLVSRLTKSLEE